MKPVWIAFLAGFFLGGNLGALMISLLVAAGEDRRKPIDKEET